ncbi:unnamed protein product [Hermetia illucens]|uniref:Uncharacterized protein n=1 Tax=Hermetia illucens TaxID=343691 RepID=A0A7R8UJK8_HERIL|nr:unnamed protein product [Hermetia illucens]
MLVRFPFKDDNHEIAARGKVLLQMLGDSKNISLFSNIVIPESEKSTIQKVMSLPDARKIPRRCELLIQLALSLDNPSKSLNTLGVAGT